MKIVVNNIEKIVVSGMALLLVLVISGGVAQAGTKEFYDDDPIVCEYTVSEFKLIRDDGWETGNLLDGPTLIDWASVGFLEKVKDVVRDKALPPGRYTHMEATMSGSTVRGVVAVNPDGWGGTWEDGSKGVRYYYTDAAGMGNKFKPTNRGDAELASEKQELTGYPETDTIPVDGYIDISHGEYLTLKIFLQIWLRYRAEYDEEMVFIGGSFGWWATGRFE